MHNFDPMGLFLDMDGTLADSIPVMRGVYFDFLNARGITGSDEEFESLNGPSLREIVEILKKKYEFPEAGRELFKRYLAMIDERYPVLCKVSEGGRELLEAVKKNGVKTGLVSSASEKLIAAFLERHHLRDLMDVVVSADCVRATKPAPEPYLKALALAALPADRCVAVEDSRQGAISAIKAGLRVYHISTGRQVSGLPINLAGSINRLDDLLELFGAS